MVPFLALMVKLRPQDRHYSGSVGRTGGDACLCRKTFPAPSPWFFLL